MSQELIALIVGVAIGCVGTLFGGWMAWRWSRLRSLRSEGQGPATRP